MDNIHEIIDCQYWVIATGGLLIPKIGTSRPGYEIIKQFGLSVTVLKPALVPLTFHPNFQKRCYALSGLSVDDEILIGKTRFREGLLFTHRGLFGPSVLQTSSYWAQGEKIILNLLPDIELFSLKKQNNSEFFKKH